MNSLLKNFLAETPEICWTLAYSPTLEITDYELLVMVVQCAFWLWYINCQSANASLCRWIVYVNFAITLQLAVKKINVKLLRMFFAVNVSGIPMVTQFRRCATLYALRACSRSVDSCKALFSLNAARLSSADCETEHVFTQHLPTSKSAFLSLSVFVASVCMHGNKMGFTAHWTVLKSPLVTVNCSHGNEN